MATKEKEKILKVENLTVSFRTTQGMVRAVRGISFDLYKGETLAIVGESGSGKSVSSRTIMGILAGNGVIDDGTIIYQGQDLTKVDEEHYHELRGNKIGMIFQDPMSSLNPIMRIGKQITEGMILNGKHLKNRVKRLYAEEKNIYHALIADKKIIAQEYRQTLKEIKAGESEESADVVKQNYKNAVAKLAQDIKDAKVKYHQAKKQAKAQVKQEWADEKKRVSQELANIKAAWSKSAAELKENISKEENPEKQKQLRAAFRAARKEHRQEVASLKENLERYKHVTKKEARERAIQIMKEVGIPEPERRYKQYPFQFSGGMRQRIVIAIALTANPQILICDEPTTALDVTIQAQILELINNLKKQRELSVIFITHDLGVVANMADRIGVMYAGKIVEYGTAEDIFYRPKHPYTWALLSSMPDLESKDRLVAIPGTPPNMLFPPKGDAFADRNKYAMKIDFEQEPPMFKITDTHYAATWLLHPDAPKVEMPQTIQDRIDRMTKHSEGVS